MTGLIIFIIVIPIIAILIWRYKPTGKYKVELSANYRELLQQHAVCLKYFDKLSVKVPS